MFTEVEQAFRKLWNGNKDDRGQIEDCALALSEMGFNPRDISHAIKVVTGKGVRFSALKKVKETGDKRPKERLSAVDEVVGREVQKAVVEEARAEIKMILEVGKEVVEFFKPIASNYGFRDVKAFLAKIYLFWDYWKDNAPALEQENEELEDALERVVKATAPEAREMLIFTKMADFEIANIFTGSLTGNYAPPEKLREYRRILEETYLSKNTSQINNKIIANE